MTQQHTTITEQEQLALAGELRVAVGKLRRRLREESHVGNLTLSQVSALHLLDRLGPMTISALARAEGMRSQSMTNTVNTLKKLQYVQTLADPSDGRQTLLDLTPAAHELVKITRANREDWLFRTMQQTLTEEDMQLLHRSVQLLTRMAES
jgi:DNA-binding MarR family transcriptional regulator